LTSYFLRFFLYL